MTKRQRVWARRLGAEEKAAIAAICERFVVEILKPRFLPDIRETRFNYPVDLFGQWRGSKYSFVLRCRSGWPDNAGGEFNAPFTHLDHVEERLTDTRFDVTWHRHTGQWWRAHSSVPLDEALQLIEISPLLQPQT